MDKPGNKINQMFAWEHMVTGGKVIECKSFDFELLNQHPSVYEVIRIMESVPLFLENHLERFHQSLQLAGVTSSFSNTEIAATIKMLIEANPPEFGNIKLLYPINPGQQNCGLTAFFIPHKYPEPPMYENGAEVVTLIKSRNNPNAKISNPDLRLLADKRIASENVFEVLLVDETGKITECSRSNIFFTDQEKIVTSPGSIVLKGITRDYIFRICEMNNIPLQERIIYHDELATFSAAFITGTSPKVLPVRRIDNNYYPANKPLVNRIMYLYNHEIELYLSSKRR